jgi:hypothetical protein
MPQIWMTYDELGMLCDCDSAAARVMAIFKGLNRRKSRDGHTRVKLNDDLATLFMHRYVDEAIRSGLDAAIDDLHFVHDRMAEADRSRGSIVAFRDLGDRFPVDGFRAAAPDHRRIPRIAS